MCLQQEDTVDAISHMIRNSLDQSVPGIVRTEKHACNSVKMAVIAKTIVAAESIMSKSREHASWKPMRCAKTAAALWSGVVETASSVVPKEVLKDKVRDMRTVKNRRPSREEKVMKAGYTLKTPTKLGRIKSVVKGRTWSTTPRFAAGGMTVQASTAKKHIMTTRRGNGCGMWMLNAKIAAKV